MISVPGVTCVMLIVLSDHDVRVRGDLDLVMVGGGDVTEGVGSARRVSCYAIQTVSRFY